MKGYQELVVLYHPIRLLFWAHHHDTGTRARFNPDVFRGVIGSSPSVTQLKRNSNFFSALKRRQKDGYVYALTLPINEIRLPIEGGVAFEPRDAASAYSLLLHAFHYGEPEDDAKIPLDTFCPPSHFGLYSTARPDCAVGERIVEALRIASEARVLSSKIFIGKDCYF